MKSRWRISPSFILLLMTVAFTAGSCRCLRLWWQAFSLPMIVGFILFSQEAISQYFETDNDDIWVEWTVFIASLGYATMFYFCIWQKNESAGGELLGGFVLFLRKLLKEALLRKPKPIPTPLTAAGTPVDTSKPAIVPVAPLSVGKSVSPAPDVTDANLPSSQAAAIQPEPPKVTP